VVVDHGEGRHLPIPESEADRGVDAPHLGWAVQRGWFPRAASARPSAAPAVGVAATG
jgi:hypothetical protein